MRVFPTYPANGVNVCPVCGTQDDGQTVLVPIDGTQEGNEMQAIPTHLHCIFANIRYSQEHGLMGLEAEKGVQQTPDY